MNETYRVVLSFSADFSFIRRGVLLVHEEIFNNNESSLANSFMDGRWSVEPRDEGNKIWGTVVHVTNNCVGITMSSNNNQQQIQWYRIQRLRDNNLTLSLVLGADASANNHELPTTTLYSNNWDWATHPEGPVAVGERIQWSERRETPVTSTTAKEGTSTRNITTTASSKISKWKQRFGRNKTKPTVESKPEPEQQQQQRRIDVTFVSVMEWTRVSPVPCRQQRAALELGGREGPIYKRLNNQDNGTKNTAKYQGKMLAGNTFCQKHAVGLASYHFDCENEDGYYVSFQHSDTAAWPALDNGAPLPTRIQFRNAVTTNDDSFAVFRGSLDWRSDCGTTWQGMERSEYNIRFDPHFLCIIGGTVTPIYNDENDEAFSVVGLSTMCCNAGLFDEFVSQFKGESEHEFEFLTSLPVPPSLAANDSSSGDDANNDDVTLITTMVDDMEQHLRSQGASIPAIRLVLEILVAAYREQRDLVDYP